MHLCNRHSSCIRAFVLRQRIRLEPSKPASTHLCNRHSSCIRAFVLRQRIRLEPSKPASTHLCNRHSSCIRLSVFDRGVRTKRRFLPFHLGAPFSCSGKRSAYRIRRPSKCHRGNTYTSYSKGIRTHTRWDRSPNYCNRLRRRRSYTSKDKEPC